MKNAVLFLLPLILSGCTLSDPSSPEQKVSENNDYGAFLGRNSNNTKDFANYKYISIEFDEYEKSTISALNKDNIKCFAYLNVGSLETYRSYYEIFKDYTFLDYENWEDERWIDVTKEDWQDFVVNTLAKNFKEKGAFGVYLDNVDVYSIVKENDGNYKATANALKNVINGITKLGLKVMMNGGAEFIDDLNDENDSFLSKIWGYHQEEVFSLILDYDNDKFGKQNTSDKKYYQDMAKIMKNKGAEIFFLEYTKDANLIDQIDKYCNGQNYHYYCSETVGLL